ncbi:serine/threonine-protein kinase [Flavobacterium anhuiense]|uniref:serine/threonine-protein kinase n=1 Tax=Flavobacterium anhuiense TaxID=459526 RepID=UPI000E6C0938|nr:serine/threonine-protein kinase [Flavobacterium anhuiense]
MIFSKGTSIYKYELIQKLGSGNFSSVWLAKDNSIDSNTALKILNPSFQTVVQLLEEARIGNKLNHPNLLKIQYADIVSYNGGQLTLIAQEYHPNGSIIGLLNSGNFLELPTAIRLFTDILRGLEHLHAQGFFHNDIKPSNILIGSKGEGILADYGITGASNSTGTAIPKDAYIIHRAPETLVGNYINIQTDIYQTGLTFYRLVNGIGNIKNDFSKYGETKFEELKSKGKIPDTKNYEAFVPQKIRKIINKAVNINPLKRFSSALEMRRELEKCCFPGFWTMDANGNLMGIGSAYKYRFEIIAKKNYKFDFNAYKIKISSNVETKIGAYSLKTLDSNNIETAKETFINWVIENAS